MLDHCGLDSILLSLKHVDGLPYGRMLVTDQVPVLVVPSLANIVGAWMALKCDAMDVPGCRWELWRCASDPDGTAWHLDLAVSSTDVRSIEVGEELVGFIRRNGPQVLHTLLNSICWKEGETVQHPTEMAKVVVLPVIIHKP